jgi:hypothetical protein
MRWLAEWRSLSDRITRLSHGARFVIEADKSLGLTLSTQAIGVYWIPALNATAAALDDFIARVEPFLTPKAEEQCRTTRQLFALKFPAYTGENAIQAMQIAVSHLLTAQAQLEHTFADFDLLARRAVERAFIHLQRTLVVDQTVASRWQDALKVGEIECEKLGAVHLLGHGIWPFKVSGTGERTDLVLGEFSEATRDQVKRAADVLVLTEWKAVESGSEKDLGAKKEQAVRQAKLYSQGVLGGVELEHVRYVVLVSEERLPKTDDLVEDGVTYRFLNIATRPATPSKERQPV